MGEYAMSLTRLNDDENIYIQCKRCPHVENLGSAPSVAQVNDAAEKHICEGFPNAVPLTTQIDNVKKIVGSATMAEDGTVTAKITDPDLWDKIKDNGPYSIGN